MTPAFTSLRQAQFQALAATDLFPAVVPNGCYGGLEAAGRLFRFSWHSALVSPVVLAVGDGAFLVGIDQSVAVASVRHGVLLYVEPDTFFVSSFVHGGFVYVVNQLSVLRLLVGESAVVVVREYDLPAMYAAHTLPNGQVVITCCDGSQVSLA